MAFIQHKQIHNEASTQEQEAQRQETQNLSWETLMGKKTQQLLQYRFNSQDTMPIQ